MTKKESSCKFCHDGTDVVDGTCGAHTPSKFETKMEAKAAWARGDIEWEEWRQVLISDLPEGTGTGVRA